MSGLYEVLQKIKSRPGMYIGKPSVTHLFHFLVGYEFARGELDIEPTEWEDDFHENFQPWLQKRYHVSTSNSWANIIMLYCGSEKEGLDSFYELLDEFRNREKAVNIKNKISNKLQRTKESQMRALRESEKYEKETGVNS
ncbi:MAG: hypothetical protein AAFV71_26420 [Cyanobacteria bacterium J06633_8]